MGDVNIQALAISLGLGLLVGLQRQWSESDIAGIRTFPLVTLLGTLVAIVDASTGWLISAGLMSVAVLLFIGNMAKFQEDRAEPGLTTEVAALLMYMVGVAIGRGYIIPSLAVGGAVAVLLQWKQPLHSFVRRMGAQDVRAVINLVLIALVILPVLPDRTFGPYHVLNPYKIWWMVVLIVGISLVAYVASKLLGPRAGAILGGILGGLISSTATTVSYARQTKENRGRVAIAAVVIVIASTVVYGRVLLEIAVVSPNLLAYAVGPVCVLSVCMSVLSVILLWTGGTRSDAGIDHENPAQIKAATIFGILYAVILFLVAAAKTHFGSEALYGIALISGLMDVDAITLSTAELYQRQQLAASTAWRVVVLATLSNLVFKLGTVFLLGHRRLGVHVGVAFGVTLAVGIAVLWWWPDYPIDVQWLREVLLETPAQ